MLVTGLYGGGPAEKAGLLFGDVVLALDGFVVNELQALRYRIATRSVAAHLICLCTVRDLSPTLQCPL